MRTDLQTYFVHVRAANPRLACVSCERAVIIPLVQVEAFRFLLALETSWTISINGKDFVHVPSTAIGVNDSTLRFDRYVRTIVEIDEMRSGAVRVRARARLRRQADVLVFFPGEKLPSAVELRRRRTVFQRSLLPALSRHFGQASRTADSLFGQAAWSWRRLPAIPCGNVSGCDCLSIRMNRRRSLTESCVQPFNGRPSSSGGSRLLCRRSEVPRSRSRLEALPKLRRAFDWLLWDGEGLSGLRTPVDGIETHVHPYRLPAVEGRVRADLRSHSRYASTCAAHRGQRGFDSI
jgi:hypothetical protein